MDRFVSRKKRKVSKQGDEAEVLHGKPVESQSTDEKLAILLSVFDDKSYDILLDALTSSDGDVERAVDYILTAPALSQVSTLPRKTSHQGVQSSLSFLSSNPIGTSNTVAAGLVKSLTKKGKTLYLYSPAEIAKHTPCSIIHNFLPTALANDLLKELLPETKSFTSATFRLFDNVVQSPHTASFYVNSLTEAEAQKSAYLYNGSTLSDVREILPTMREVSKLVDKAVNDEIKKRIREHYPDKKKLKYQPPPGSWTPNAAFVNCYDGPQQNVGWHTDQLTYLGPHPTIGSLSLGVQREFRIRRIVPTPDIEGLSQAEADKVKEEAADAQGQISLPLPHNSLLIMHAEMQEDWKHSVSPVSLSKGIVPHPIAGNKRLNITYRWYRREFEPKYTQRCNCKVKVKTTDQHGNEVEVEEGVPCVLKSIMRRAATRGQYMWMCQTPGRVDMDLGGATETKGCGFFEKAEFDDNGVPLNPYQNNG